MVCDQQCIPQDTVFNPLAPCFGVIWSLLNLSCSLYVTFLGKDGICDEGVLGGLDSTGLGRHVVCEDQ